jgi:hypothetical protein
MTNSKQLYSEQEALNTVIKWEIEITHNSVHYLVVWVVYTDPESGYIQGNLDTFIITEDGAISLSDKIKETNVLAAAKALRWSEIQAEQKVSLTTPRLHVIENLVESIFNRSQKAEFVGQNGANVYYQEVAKIIGYPEKEVYKAAQNLTKQGKLGLSGNILISPELFEENYEYNLQNTGHKGYESSDVGGLWRCKACGAQGWHEDPNSLSPEKIRCLNIEEK